MLVLPVADVSIDDLSSLQVAAGIIAVARPRATTQKQLSQNSASVKGCLKIP
jgi:hypothetical protein